MKVYLVWDDNPEYGIVVGVYKNREDAEKHNVQYHKSIEEWEVRGMP